jgi:hypothetical protein
MGPDIAQGYRIRPPVLTQLFWSGFIVPKQEQHDYNLRLDLAYLKRVFRSNKLREEHTKAFKIQTINDCDKGDGFCVLHNAWKVSQHVTV